MNIKLIVMFFAAVIWVLNSKLFIGKRFVIKLTKSKAIVLKGRPPKQFVVKCNTMARQKNTPGYIYALNNHEGIALIFTKHIAEGTVQRLRNVFPFEQYRTQKPSTTPNDNGNRKNPVNTIFKYDLIGTEEYFPSSNVSLPFQKAKP